MLKYAPMKVEIKLPPAITEIAASNVEETEENSTLEIFSVFLGQEDATIWVVNWPTFSIPPPVRINRAQITRYQPSSKILTYSVTPKVSNV